MSLVVDVLGSAIAIDVPDELDSGLTELLIDYPRGRSPERHVTIRRDDAGSCTLLDDGCEVLGGVAPDVAIATIVWHLNTIAAASSNHVVIHAGCVADDSGALLLPGRSGSGKSWLTAALVAEGFHYLSDEHAALDTTTGLIDPLAKPLDLGPRGLSPPSALRADSIAASSPPTAIVFPRYQPGAEIRVTPLDAPTTLMELCGHSPSLATQRSEAFLWLAALALTLPAALVTYDDSVRAIESICQWRRSAWSPATSKVSPAVPTAPVTKASTTVPVGDELLVFDGETGRVHRLNHSAGFVWLSAARCDGRRQLCERVLTEAPVGALDPADVVATIDRLCALGLLSFTERPE